MSGDARSSHRFGVSTLQNTQMAKPSSKAQTASAAETPIKPETTAESAAPKIERYYRIKKHTGFLYEILEVEVDENLIAPQSVSKQDMLAITQDKAMPFLYSSEPARIRKK